MGPVDVVRTVVGGLVLVIMVTTLSLTTVTRRRRSARGNMISLTKERKFAVRAGGKSFMFGPCLLMRAYTGFG